MKRFALVFVIVASLVGPPTVAQGEQDDRPDLHLISE
jgi:hypothetical protein